MQAENKIMDKKQAKERIIDAAIECFVKHGIKAVRMDDIASKLLMSKRTIYELFETKENLVRQALLKTRERQNANTNRMKEEANGDILNLMMNIFKTETQHLADVNPLFFADLAEYPSLVSMSNEDSAARRDRIRSLFDEGIKKGVFRKEVNYDLFIEAFSMQNTVIFKQELYLKYTMLEIFKSYSLSVFRGLLTEEAVKRFDQQFLTF